MDQKYALEISAALGRLNSDLVRRHPDYVCRVTANEDFADCLAWWHNRAENERAWCVRVEDVLKVDEQGNILAVNLDTNNPNSPTALEHRAREELVESILRKEARIVELMAEIRAMVKSE